MIWFDRRQSFFTLKQQPKNTFCSGLFAADFKEKLIDGVTKQNKIVLTYNQVMFAT